MCLGFVAVKGFDILQDETFLCFQSKHEFYPSFVDSSSDDIAVNSECVNKHDFSAMASHNRFFRLAINECQCGLGITFERRSLKGLRNMPILIVRHEARLVKSCRSLKVFKALSKSSKHCMRCVYSSYLLDTLAQGVCIEISLLPIYPNPQRLSTNALCVRLASRTST